MSAKTHPFVLRPHRTMLSLSVPVLFSLIAEPLTGLVDTAFVARLGATPLAALGVGTAALSSIFWVFNFLGIGTQTEVAQARGRNADQQARGILTLALGLSLLLGSGLVLLGWPAAGWAAAALGATGETATLAVAYMRVRLFAAPAILILLTAFGALRGVEDMKTPLWVALGLNGLNVGLDALLIEGVWLFPALGVVGAAWASVIAQWVGAFWAVGATLRRLGRPAAASPADVGGLLRIGGDLFIRTFMLTLFLLLTTRVATQAGDASGAAHQAIRQFWTFTALGLDALAITAQSLVAFFLGAAAVGHARRVAGVGALWGVALGLLLLGGMLLGQGGIAALLVPAEALPLFAIPWLLAAAAQPMNALAFVTDGIHWGTGDFTYLRNGMILSTLVAGSALFLIDPAGEHALTWVWGVTMLWIALRTVWGLVRVWPGVGRAPLAGRRPV